MNIRAASHSDTEWMWNIFRSVAERGDTLPTCNSANREAMSIEWFDKAVMPFVAVDAGMIVGMYKLGANQPDLGSHVASATFMVHPSHQGKGIGTALVEHCLDKASASGFASIQFNFVVSSNVAALSLYRRFGFSVAGALPGAFRHSELGFVDALVMFKVLQPAGT